jgi:8-oxo-dGTP diphosphatase
MEPRFSTHHHGNYQHISKINNKHIMIPLICKFRGATTNTINTSTSSIRQFCIEAKGKTTMMIYPRAAVAATLQWTNPTTNSYHYLLVRRRNPPDQNKWSIPGGAIEIGEETLTAAKREILEETQIRDCLWHSNSFLTTDAIVPDELNNNAYAFHYVIAHCFAKMPTTSGNASPALTPSDDALDAKWLSLEEIKSLECSQHLSKGVIEVITKAETFSTLGILPVQ